MTFNEIFDIAVQILLLVVGGLLVPYIKARIGESKYKQIYDTVLVGVAAAEQIYKSLPKSAEKNEQRFQFVAKYLTDRGFKVTETELKALIEGAVLSLNEGIR